MKNMTYRAHAWLITRTGGLAEEDRGSEPVEKAWLTWIGVGLAVTVGIALAALYKKSSAGLDSLIP